jgi:hypothetical protein
VHGPDRVAVRVLTADGALVALARWAWLLGNGRQQWEPTWEGLPVLHPSIVLV